ncbi:hypothetical protein BGX23_011175 [Mortierella sp. AD031]|nr:hypothetical protein BGX23_011175 [Mortierella sp. AD031]KAG0214757.1 hypothetical protein BGX33_001874 [Mortierella sp. NVP41]
MNSSSTRDDRDGGGGGGWGFEFDVEAMKQTTSAKRKQQRRIGDYHSGDHRSMDDQGTDDDNWYTEGEQAGAESKPGFSPLPEVAWEDRSDLTRQTHGLQNHQEHRAHQPRQERPVFQERPGYHGRQMYQERPSRHMPQRNAHRDPRRQPTHSSPGWNSRHQWFSGETGSMESNVQSAENRHDRKADEAEDDVWGLSRTERWTAPNEEEVAGEKEEVVLDELTKYWAPSNILDLIRPNRSQQAFADRHNRITGQIYDGDNWGDAPDPSMAYNGEYTNTVLVEQRNKEYWAQRDGQWILLNQSLGTKVTSQQNEDNLTISEDDNDNCQTSSDESDHYSQGWSDYHVEDSSPTHSEDQDLERKRNSGVYPGPAPPKSGTQEYLSKMRKGSYQEQFDLDAGFMPEDEWRKPQSERARRREEGGPSQARNGQTGSWSTERTSWERPVSRASALSDSESVLDVLPETMPDFSTAKPGDQTVIFGPSNPNNSTRLPAPKTGGPILTMLSQSALLVDLDEQSVDEAPLSPESHNVVQSLMGLDFTDFTGGHQDDSQNAHSLIFDSTSAVATDKAPKVDPESAKDEPKQEGEKAASPLITIASELVDNTHVSAEVPSSKGEATVDLLGSDNLAQEPSSSKGEFPLDILGCDVLAEEPSKGDSSLDLLAITTSPSQERANGDLSLDIIDSRSPTKGLLSSGFLDDLASPYDWLNQIASRSMRHSEESRVTQQEQWNALMAKQEMDSNRIQDFIQRTTSAGAATIDSSSSASASSKRGSKPKVPFSLTMAIETKDHGRQALTVTERNNLKDMVEGFCRKYDMQTYEMALWVTVAKAIKKLKKARRENNMQQKQQQ